MLTVLGEKRMCKYVIGFLLGSSLKYYPMLCLMSKDARVLEGDSVM